jgi:hypothetical protein
MEDTEIRENKGFKGLIKGLAVPEPRWPALLALLALGGLYAALPPAVAAGGPRWLLLAILSVMLVPAIIAHVRHKHSLSQVMGYFLNGVVTVSMIWSLALLILALPGRKTTPQQLLLAAAVLWVSKILVFASWYWRLDAGGPHQRELVAGHYDGAFLFPQMMMRPEAKKSGTRRGLVAELYRLSVPGIQREHRVLPDSVGSVGLGETTDHGSGTDFSTCDCIAGHARG